MPVNDCVFTCFVLQFKARRISPSIGQKDKSNVIGLADKFSSVALQTRHLVCFIHNKKSVGVWGAVFICLIGQDQMCKL